MCWKKCQIYTKVLEFSMGNIYGEKHMEEPGMVKTCGVKCGETW